MDTVIGKRVKAEGGEGIVVAVAHAGGGPGLVLTAASALNAQVVSPEPFVA